MAFLTSATSGTSPRMRGKLRQNFTGLAEKRNIPAYAGKTPTMSNETPSIPEHPRVCGENSGGFSVGHGVFGTSPRMRGKPPNRLRWRKAVRNIPAYAGKTTSEFTVVKSEEEHPRVCGENKFLLFHLHFLYGTSPRMRGKPMA